MVLFHDVLGSAHSRDITGTPTIHKVVPASDGINQLPTKKESGARFTFHGSHINVF
jgi:hypothetical protein